MSAGSDKSADAFRTISEVASELGLATHVLRFWESKFPQIKPLKRAGGRRYYRPDDVALLRRLQTLLHDEGYTIKGVQKLFREEGARKFIDEGAVAQNGSFTEEPAPHTPLPQASLFDSPSREPLPTNEKIELVEPIEPNDITVQYRPDLLPKAPEPEPVLEPEEMPQTVIQQGLSETQRALLGDILEELKALKEEIDTAA
ncbi:MAG: MerR family transcriptional regulator [Methylocystaceae bacterium]|nr:MerR family transcriptional regulator [Methylocystaceae bacterium]